MKKGLFFLEKVCATLILFLLPTQLALHFWPSYAFVFGIRVDYLSPAVYLTDLLIFGLLILFVSTSRNVLIKFLSRNRIYFLVLGVFAIINIYLSSLPPVTAFRWLKIFEAVFLAVYIFLRKQFLGNRLILSTLFSSGVVFSIIGISQFFLGRTTGFFYFLGERSFNLSTPGIALAQIKGMDFLRVYSTFSHPNSLAGYLGIILIVLFSSGPFTNKVPFYIGILVIFLAFFLTFSLSALLALAILGVICFIKTMQKSKKSLMKNFLYVAILASLVLPIVAVNLFRNHSFPLNVNQRLDLSVLAGKMISENFWAGEGLNTFILNSTKFSGLGNSTWFLQPVHNIFLLVFAETGIFGLIFFFILLYKAVSFSFNHHIGYFAACLFFILFTGLTDHYWLTLQQDVLLMSVISGYFLNLEE